MLPQRWMHWSPGYPRGALCYPGSLTNYPGVTAGPTRRSTARYTPPATDTKLCQIIDPAWPYQEEKEQEASI